MQDKYKDFGKKQAKFVHGQCLREMGTQQRAICITTSVYIGETEKCINMVEVTSFSGASCMLLEVDDEIKV